MLSLFRRSICFTLNYVYSNILSDVPTNCQLIIRILRDGEHKRRPLPPPGGESELPESESDEEEEEDEEEADEDEGNGGIKKMEKMMDAAKTNMSGRLRSRMRRAWDKAGSRKEEVRPVIAQQSQCSLLSSPKGFALITGHKKVDFESKAEVRAIMSVGRKTADDSWVQKSLLEKLDVSLDSKSAKAFLKHMPSAPDENSPDNPSRELSFQIELFIRVWHEAAMTARV